jgi:hypothetical protein
LIEEGYVNFHVVGVVLVAALAGLACGHADRRYRTHLRILESSTRPGSAQMLADQPTYMVLYPVMVGLWLFILRGDLLSGMAFATAMALAFLVVNTIVRRRVHRR